MITTENITSHELIGLDTEVVNSSNLQLIGLNGRIINETKSMLTIDTQKGKKLIPKDNTNWKFSIHNTEIIIDGSKITKRPFDRIGGKK